MKPDVNPLQPKNYKPREGDEEDNGPLLPNRKNKSGGNYLMVDGRLKCRSCDKRKFLQIIKS